VALLLRPNGPFKAHFGLIIGHFILILGLILMENDLCDEFFARSPQNLTVLAPFMVLKQSNFGENVQKTRRTGHFPLKSVYNTT